MANIKLQYNMEIIEEALRGYNFFDLLKIDPTTIYNFNKKESKTINKILDLYKDVKLYRDASTVELEHYEKEDIINISNQFLIGLFPKYEKDILDLDKLLEFDSTNTIDQGLFFYLTSKQVVFKNIKLLDNYNGYLISTIAHEKMHALAFKYLNTKELLSKELELLPIFIQKILMSELEEDISTDIIIYDSINRTVDGKHIGKLLEMVYDNEKDSNRTELDKMVMTYIKIKALRYVTAEVYSLLLLKYYQQDRNKMVENLNRLLAGKLSINEFLAIYDVNLNNRELIPTLKENLDIVKRKIIIP